MPTTIGKEEEEDEAALSLISPVAESGLGLGLGSKDNGSFSSPLLSLSPTSINIHEDRRDWNVREGEGVQ